MVLVYPELLHAAVDLLNSFVNEYWTEKDDELVDALAAAANGVQVEWPKK